MAGYRVISSDDHIIEPPDLWTSRVETKFKDRVPRIVREPHGVDWWYCDGHKVTSMFSGTQTGLRFEAPEDIKVDRDTFEDVRPGGYIPDEHIKDMDIDGVDVSILYPTLGNLLYNLPDSELLTVNCRTYNDWIAEFCSAHPKRLKGIAMLNIDDLESGIKELERSAKLGFAGVMISIHPSVERSYNLPIYEPLWAAAQDLQIPLSLHVGTNRPGPGQDFEDVLSGTPWFLVNMDHWVKTSLAQLIFSGVFERYPKLQVGSVEMELSWVPHFLDRMDYAYTQRQAELITNRFKEDMLPSDFFHQNVYLSFQEDALGIRERYIIGVDNLMWGSDYPHAESTFPRSREIIEEILVDCTEEEKAKIAGGNAVRVYHLV